MVSPTTQDLEAAQASISSTIRKSEKACATLSQKQQPRLGQMAMLSKNIQNLSVMLALIRRRLGDVADPPSAQAMEEALRAIPSYIGQIEKVLPKFPVGTPQHTLALRRIAAYRLAESLLRGVGSEAAV